MIITTEMLLHSNGCMTQKWLDKAATSGVYLDVTSVDDGIRLLLANGHRELAAFVKLAEKRWRLKEEGAMTVRYMVLDPLTGQHVVAATEGEAKDVQAAMLKKMEDHYRNVCAITKLSMLANGDEVADVLQ